MGVCRNCHGQRPHGLGRGCAGRPLPGRPRLRGGVPRLPDREGPRAHRGHLEHDLPRRLLPGRRRHDERPLRHRPGALGHQGQKPRRPRLRTARRRLPRQDEGLLVDWRRQAVRHRCRRKGENGRGLLRREDERDGGAADGRYLRQGRRGPRACRGDTRGLRTTFRHCNRLPRTRPQADDQGAGQEA